MEECIFLARGWGGLVWVGMGRMTTRPAQYRQHRKRSGGGSARARGLLLSIFFALDNQSFRSWVRKQLDPNLSSFLDSFASFAAPLLPLLSSCGRRWVWEGCFLASIGVETSLLLQPCPLLWRGGRARSAKIAGLCSAVVGR